MYWILSVKTNTHKSMRASFYGVMQVQSGCEDKHTKQNFVYTHMETTDVM